MILNTLGDAWRRGEYETTQLDGRTVANLSFIRFLAH